MKIDINKYLGRWHEIARIPNQFEPNMSNVTAEYSLMGNGDILIVNSGFIDTDFKAITAFAKTTEDDSILKVSFFPGIESNYKILAIEENYEYALVGGDDDNHLWLLGRTPYISLFDYVAFLRFAKMKGYNVEKMKITP